MLNKTSDITIDTKESQLFFCPICGNHVKSKDFDHIQHICKNCDKDLKDEHKKNAHP
jgi:predicted RNA-binding Zn-ribbon protein involved in translation (DUF1610 family)